MASILDSPGLPKQANSPTFNEPWEARAFAMVLVLQQRGLFTWPDWTAALAAEIASAQQRGDPDLGDTYYQHWLRALEKLLVDRGAITV
jgi:nitrile hydratase accessory protein